MYRRSSLAFVLALLGALPNAVAKERVWTDTAGRTMRAEFVREVDGDVTFLRGGKLVTIPLDKLTTTDQQVVRDLAAGKPLPEDVPAAPREGEFGSSETGSATSGGAPSAPATSSSEGSPLLRQPIPIENRVWTDIHGNQTAARYVRVFGANVVLSRSGRSITVKYHELTAGDQEYLKELLASRGQEALIPPATSDLNEVMSADSQREPPEREAADRSSQGASSAVPAGAPFDAGSTAPPGRDSETPIPGPDSASPFGPAESTGGGHTVAPPGRPMGMASPPSGSANAGYAPATTALPPGMSSPSTSGTASSTNNFSSSASPSYDSGMGSSNRYSSPLGERVAYGQPASHGYGYSSSIDPIVGACSSCRRSVTQSQSTGSNCPHCGIHWSYKQDPVTRQRLPIPRLNSAPAAIDPRTARIIGIVVGSFAALLVVVGLIIGVIYAVMGLASVSSGTRDRHMLR